MGNDISWKCLFCNAENKSNKAECSKCKKANTALVNINRICVCGRKVTKYPYEFYQCFACCKLMEKEEKGYYWCNAKQCTYREMTGDYFAVCSACYESTNSTATDPNRSFLFCKVASLVKQTKKETKQCKNNDERRRYMYWVYSILYKRCIAKSAKFMNESESKAIQDIFNTFYGGVMDEIKRSIDAMELGLASDIFVNKKNVKRKEWVKMNAISLKWQMLAEEEQFEKEKEEKVSAFEDTGCNDDDVTKCGSRKRIEFVMRFYKAHFLKRFVYHNTDTDDSSSDDMHYIEIFEGALDGYTATDLLNDYFHLERYHALDKELRDCMYDDSENDIDICCSLLWREAREARYQWSARKTSKNNEIYIYASIFIYKNGNKIN